MEQTLTGDAVTKVAELAREGAAVVRFVELPPGMLPQGVLGTPSVAILESPGSAPRIEGLKRFADEYRVKPDFREGTASATTLDSFARLVLRHASADTAVFVDANWKAPRLTAVIDYHVIAPQREVVQRSVNLDEAVFVGDLPSAPVDADPLARFGRHRIVYAFPLSEPWKLWVANDAKPMDQVAFAQFIEDHIQDIASPDNPERVEWETKFKTNFADPVGLVDLARGLEVNVGAKVKSKARLQSGEVQLQFETEHRAADGGELRVPGLFLLSVPIFYQGEEARIPVRLRYRVTGGELVWYYQIFRPDLFVDERVQADVDTVARETALPVYHGHPEVR